MGINYEIAYKQFIESIDNSQANKDWFGTLSDNVDCSARGNATGTTDNEKYQSMLETAQMIMGCWEDFYPDLIKNI